MLHSPLPIKPCAAFWDEVARSILKSELLASANDTQERDLSTIRVIVPTFIHAQQLKIALAGRMSGTFIPPRITTLPAWLALQPPTGRATAEGERLMSLYSVLREQAWLKKLFTARRNTDLLPLAQTLLALCDELTQALLPEIRLAPGTADVHWRTALGQLSPAARELLSDETQLVWSIWQSQLDASDPGAVRLEQMMRLAEGAAEPLVCVTPVEPDVFETVFLNAYGKRLPVLPVTLDWRAAAIEPAFAAAWPELLNSAPDPATSPVSAIAPPACLSLYEAQTLEDEAQQGAQTIVNWLSAGKTRIAIIAQDRVVARRIRALLERARILVADETGWKLSTTRAAAALAAWFEVVAARGESIGLLDLLKSPFMFAETGDKSERVMKIEAALRRANVSGGWDAVDAALAELPAERAMLARVARDANAFASGRRTLVEWVAATGAVLDALEMRAALAADDAGAQVVALLEAIGLECRALEPSFSFAEWRAFVNLRLESISFAAPLLDDRVVMLPLNGAHLRVFDAVLLVGADADHLPSKPSETLFFANAVRRELGLATRESRQLRQLRDFAELLQANGEVVLSWQANRNGESNPVSPWIARLQLTLERAGAASIPMRPSCIPARSLVPVPVARPAPSAPQLLPAKLSASGYNSLVACPYQFFATRMLRLDGLDELSDMPEKRDYGDWLHQILKMYHDTLRDQKVPLSDREQLLAQISEKIFERELARNAAALGYYARWKKAAPAYLAWANEREAQGWHFTTGEEWLEKPLPLPQGSITLHGRIDRIDENAAGERAVLDYKTRTQQALNGKFRQLEDHQLPFYGLLSDTPASAAHYVALEPVRDKTGDAAAPNFAQWQHMLADQIVRNMHAISQGASLPASGIEAVCQYCEVRGLCRKGAWE